MKLHLKVIVLFMKWCKKSVIFRNLKNRKKTLYRLLCFTHRFYNIHMEFRLIILLYLKYSSFGTYVTFY